MSDGSVDRLNLERAQLYYRLVTDDYGFAIGDTPPGNGRTVSADRGGVAIGRLDVGRDAYSAGRDLTVTNYFHSTLERSAADDPKRRVFVVHGRNVPARSAMFTFLHSIGLSPIEWSEAVKMTGEGSPYIGQVLDIALKSAQAIVVLFKPDDVAYLRSEYASGEDDAETVPKGQARPNVLFEAGMAMGRDPSRTVLVELGQLRSFSDIVGRHAVRMDDSPQKRNELAHRLKSAECTVDLAGTFWLTAGDFSVPLPFNGSSSPGKQPRSGNPPGVELDAKFYVQTNQCKLEIINRGSEAIYDLDVEFPEGLQGLKLMDECFPLPKLPAGKSLGAACALTIDRNFTHFDLAIMGRTVACEPVRQEVFIDVSS